MYNIDIYDERRRVQEHHKEHEKDSNDYNDFGYMYYFRFSGICHGFFK